jgi:hypothetical protein
MAPLPFTKEAIKQSLPRLLIQRFETVISREKTA